jgi:hypothetical protein
MTKSITKIIDLGYGWTGMLYSDGTMRLQGDLQESDRIDLPKDSVDRLTRICREIQEE